MERGIGFGTRFLKRRSDAKDLEEGEAPEEDEDRSEEVPIFAQIDVGRNRVPDILAALGCLR